MEGGEGEEEREGGFRVRVSEEGFEGTEGRRHWRGTRASFVFVLFCLVCCPQRESLSWGFLMGRIYSAVHAF